MWIISENFRKFDEGDNFATNTRCDGCASLAEQYIYITNGVYCKGCLTRMIDALDKNFMEHCENDWKKRQEKENVKDNVRN